MRTRVSNKTKRFTDFGISLDGDEEGSFTPDTGDGDLSDENFAAPDDNETDVSLHEDDVVSEADDDDDDDDNASDASDQGDATASTSAIGGPRTGAATPARRRRPPKPPPPPPRPGGPDYHELPVYPLDPRLPTRAYNGPLRRGARYGVLRNIMYGPDYHKAKLIWDLMDRWAKYPVLPGRYEAAGGAVLPTPWVPLGFESDREEAACRWYEGFWAAATATAAAAELPRSHAVLPRHGERIVPRAGPVEVLLGPAESQTGHTFACGTGLTLSASGLPVGEQEDPAGWMFDVGGIVIGMGWAPIPTGDRQVLALAVIPHSDQVGRKEDDGDDGGPGSDEEKNGGSIQFWEVGFDKDEDGRPRPCERPPSFFLAKCFDWGRPRRMQWCPVSFAGAGIYGLLAVLCGDGRVRVLDVKATDDRETTAYEWVESPMATLGFADNYNVEATCFTWLGANRLALGHTDGSITLWSVHPAQMLQRHAVHTSMVLDISSGYPSQPGLVASVPVGGFTSLVDLADPTGELTYVNAPGINFQPAVLDWSDHLQGWFALSPAGGPGLNTLAFLSARYFPLPKPMLTSMSMPLCLSTQGPHPHGLVGCADGSLWSFNALSKLFRQREEDSFKIKVLEHEFRPPDAFTVPVDPAMDQPHPQQSRGAARFLQGFLPEVNDDPRSERLRVINKERREKAVKRSKKKKTKPAGKRKAAAAAGLSSDSPAGADDDAPGDDVSAHMASRMVIHEPLTRVAAAAWNPNAAFGTWAAVAMGSGLVRVLDVGVE